MTTLPCTILSWLTVAFLGCLTVLLVIWTGWKIFDSTRTCENVWDALIERKRWREALWNYRDAQRRMLHKYHEGDEAVKRDLWRNLHTCESRASELLDDEDSP